MIFRVKSVILEKMSQIYKLAMSVINVKVSFTGEKGRFLMLLIILSSREKVVLL